MELFWPVKCEECNSIHKATWNENQKQYMGVTKSLQTTAKQ